MRRFNVRATLSVLVPTGVAFVSGMSACGHPATLVDPPCGGPGQCGETPETVVYSAVRPAPLSGGTLLIANDGKTALVSDPEHDLVAVADISAQNAVAPTMFATTAGAQPGRGAEDAAGRFYVVLRQAGSVMTIANGATTVTPVCAAPRGITYASAAGSLYVACAGGELVRLTPGATPTIEATTLLAPDLRDVVASDTLLFVSHFRTAALDTVTFAGVLIKTRTPLGYTFGNSMPGSGQPRTFLPDVAWKLIARPGGQGPLMLHQQALSSPVDDSGDSVGQLPNAPPGGSSEYGGFPSDDCPSALVHGQVTAFDETGEVDQLPNMGGLDDGPLPIDLGLSSDGQTLNVVQNGSVVTAATPKILGNDGCAAGLMGGPVPIHGRAVAAQFDAASDVVVQYRQPSRLEIATTGGEMRTVLLGTENRDDTGFELFHGNPDPSPMNIACASCHPEGGDDGHVWNFKVEGARRTMSLANNVTERAPFHWQGDLPDISSLMDEVFTKRMGGAPQSDERKAALESYLALFPPAAAVAGLDANAVARGKTLFESADAGCTACHTGPQLSTKAIVDVGTGAPFKVPSLLGVGMRAPYLHDGSAPTLTDRFGPAGGGDHHGHTSQLTSDQVSDLVAYLSSL